MNNIKRKRLIHPVTLDVPLQASNELDDGPGTLLWRTLCLGCFSPVPCHMTYDIDATT